MPRVVRRRRIPPELIDEILKHLADDKTALAACSLVCKAWLHPSRRHLFAEVYVDRRNAKKSLPSTTPSPFSRYICRLFLFGTISTSLCKEILPRLRLLENLRSLTIMIGRPMWDFKVPASIFSNFDQVVRLHLYLLSFTSFAHLAQVVCAFRNLNALIIAGVDWSESRPPSPTVSPPQTLRALEFEYCDWVTILKWLLSLDQIPSLNTLCIRGSQYHHGTAGDTSTLSTFLQALGPQLVKFWFKPEESELIFDLTHNPSLRSLTIKFWRKPPIPQYLSRLLSGLISSNVEEIAIGLSLSDKEIDAMKLNHVDTMLAQPQFSKLKTLCICKNGDISAWFIHRLPQSHSRGILSFRPAPPSSWTII